MEIIMFQLCKLTGFAWLVSVHVLSLLPTAHSPGCRWDALISTAESVLCAGLRYCIHNEALPAITWRRLALTKREEKQMEYLEWVARILCGALLKRGGSVFLTAAASVRHQRKQIKNTANSLPAFANRCFHPMAAHWASVTTIWKREYHVCGHVVSRMMQSRVYRRGLCVFVGKLRKW